MTVLTLPSAVPCSANPDLFFAPDDETATRRNWREGRAKAICARCPFQAACLDYAVTEKIYHGIWGGATDAERVTLRRRRRAKIHNARYRARKAAA